MDFFRNHHESHEHSQGVLDIIYCYDSFMDSVTTIADMGCGSGLDIKWWAECMSRDDPPMPRNYICYAVDKDTKQINTELPKNVNVIEDNFETVVLPRKMDIVMSHDSFQYATNPLGTLKNWNANMNKNAMLVLVLPQMTSYLNNRLVVRSHNNIYFNHNVITLLYMLGVNGFDCKDMYVYKSENDPWIKIVTYKTNVAPMDPSKTTWFDLIEQDLVHSSIAESVKKHNYVRQEDLIIPWIDQNFYYVRD